ncbi:tributyrin esterase [Candidatus Laterigemmans baculatus]|uniref:tributyrin esterase n=1 Tax=Candidatus Laterigemmans baculatus TaxID=2770505 RepID=UPI0013DAD3AD|nr:tributyrin esterase [Candidatus Laterigemmans baculatus]
MERTSGSADGVVINAAGRSLDQLRAALAKIPATAASVQIRGAAGTDRFLMALDTPLQLVVEGPLGDYAFAFHRQAQVRVNGAVGDGVAEGMASGVVRIDGDAGVGAGTAVSGGTLAIYGAAGARCGAALQGGEIFVRGNVGPGAASGAVGGTIVIGGDAAEGLGDAMRGTTVFIRGRVAALGRGAREAPLRERERLRLGLLLINAGIRGDAKEFRRIVSDALLQHEARRPRGELDPSWR